MSYSDMDIRDTGKYLKIKGGETAHFHIVTKHPKVEMVHGFGKEKLHCKGDGCISCKRGDPVKQRFFINVYDRKAGKLKVYEFGSGVARSIKELALLLKEDGRTVHDVDFKIRASGSGLETRYTVMQVPKSGHCPVSYAEEFDPLKEQDSFEPTEEEGSYDE